MGDASKSAVEGEDGNPDEATAHALPKQAHARRAAAVAPLPSTPGPQVSQQLAIATLREEEVDTSKQMIRAGRLLGVATAIPLPFIAGNEGLKIALLGAILVALVSGFIVERRLRAGTLSGETMAIAFAYSVSPAIFISTLFFGVLSAAQLFPALALYFFCRREKLSSAVALYLTNALTQLVVALLIIGGAFEDPGIVSEDLAPHVFAIGHGLLQVGFFCAFMLGRGSHNASREAIQKMQNAVLLAAQRDALLHEARQDLDRALAIDNAGRFTDHTFGGYRLGHVIGRGGMGEVYEALHIDTGDVAAVKLLAQRELGNPQSVERFAREVRAVRSLRSKHVVRVLAYSEGGNEIPYLVMERLRGNDLAHHLRSGRMAPSALLEMLKQIGDAIEEAWTHGIVHRDLKPQNVFLLDRDPATWKVLDFGVAALDESSGTLTQGKVVGTPSYMAPEQAKGEKVDHRADVYALGAIAYRWLTGRPVVTGKDLHNALYQTVHVMPQKPSTLAELHVDVDAVLAIALVKSPDDRWQSADDLRAALTVALDGNLDPRTRRRAADLLARHPWGAVRN